jgi:hypothetical protein
MGTESGLLGFALYFTGEVVHEDFEWLAQPVEKAFVEGTDDKLDLFVVLTDGLGDSFSVDGGALANPVESFLRIMKLGQT